MVLAVNPSKKVILGITTLTAFGLVTVLFYRSRGNTQTTASSLAEKDVSIMRSIPIIGSAINYFYPIVKEKAPALPIRQVGNSSSLVTSIEVLTTRLVRERQDHQALTALIIHGDNLELIQDPGILALHPAKLILIGIRIAKSNEPNSLWQLMKKQGWHLYKGEISILTVKSDKEAISKENPINPISKLPSPTVYSVEG